MNVLTQFLIENCSSVFGEDVLTLLGDPDEEELADSTGKERVVPTATLHNPLKCY